MRESPAHGCTRVPPLDFSRALLVLGGSRNATSQWQLHPDVDHAVASIVGEYSLGVRALVLERAANRIRCPVFECAERRAEIREPLLIVTRETIRRERRGDGARPRSCAAPHEPESCVQSKRPCDRAWFLGLSEPVVARRPKGHRGRGVQWVLPARSSKESPAPSASIEPDAQGACGSSTNPIVLVSLVITGRPAMKTRRRHTR